MIPRWSWNHSNPRWIQNEIRKWHVACAHTCSHGVRCVCRPWGTGVFLAIFRAGIVELLRILHGRHTFFQQFAAGMYRDWGLDPTVVDLDDLYNNEFVPRLNAFITDPPKEINLDMASAMHMIISTLWLSPLLIVSIVSHPYFDDIMSTGAIASMDIIMCHCRHFPRDHDLDLDIDLHSSIHLHLISSWAHHCHLHRHLQPSSSWSSSWFIIIITIISILVIHHRCWVQ